MKKPFLLLLLLHYVVRTAVAQSATDYVWWNPIQSVTTAATSVAATTVAATSVAATSFIEGQGWNRTDLQNPYDRLPAKAEKTVRTPVWGLSHNSAGLMIRFRASTDKIAVRYVVTGKQALPHMPATGVSGVDLYGINSDGDWLWCAGKYTFGDTIQYVFQNLEPNDTYHQKGREYRLYLPLYNSVKWLEIGTPKTLR